MASKAGYPETDGAEAVGRRSSVCYDERVIGYLAVPTDDADDILHRGYVLSTKWDSRVPPKDAPKPLREGQELCHTSRCEVPYSTDPVQAVKALRVWRSAEAHESLTVLELLKVAEDGSKLPEERMPTQKYAILPDPDTNMLDKKFIRRGVALRRGEMDYDDVPCLICGGSLKGFEKQRGQVGLAVYVRNAFMVAPCPNENCKQLQQERQTRLDTMPKLKLYHACSRQVADLIKSSGGKMIRGVCGAGGGGIYLAHTRREAEWKAEIKEKVGSHLKYMGHLKHFKPSSTRAVVLEVEAKLGKMYLGKRDEKGMTFKDLINKGYDSCVLDRGETGYPDDKVPDAPVKIGGKSVIDGTHPGYEFVIYSWDQVIVLREVDRDPSPLLADEATIE